MEVPGLRALAATVVSRGEWVSLATPRLQAVDRLAQLCKKYQRNERSLGALYPEASRQGLTHGLERVACFMIPEGTPA